MSKSKINLYKMSGSHKQEERIENGLKLLGLEGMRTALKYLTQQSIGNGTLYDYLENLLEKEMAWKDGNRQERWTLYARFPFKASFEDYDFSFPEKIDKELIQELASCRFIDRAENVLLLGPTGVGKTHLGIAFGQEAIRNGYDVKFLKLGELIESFEKNQDFERIYRLKNSLQTPKLLIIDEMDFYNTSPAVAVFLFKLLYERSENKSTIFTSNTPPYTWGALFGNPTRSSAIIDRILGRAHAVVIEGESHRLRDKPKASKKN